MARKPVPVPVQIPEEYKEVRFPLGGLDLSHAFSNQPNVNIGDDVARTTPVGVNVRSFDPSTDRARGGARPGISRFVNSQISGTNPAQCLTGATVTDGNVPGSGVTVATYLGGVGRLYASSDLSLFTTDDLNGYKTDISRDPGFASSGLTVSARAFVSGGSNPSYSSLGIAAGTGVTVALALCASGSTAQYVMVANGFRFASAPFTLPGTNVDITATVVMPSSSYHIFLGLQLSGVIIAGAIDDTGAVVWSNSSVGSTSEPIGPDGTFLYKIGAVITGTYICANLPGATGVIRCDLANGNNPATLKTNSAIEVQAGSNYRNSLDNTSATRNIAATSAGVLAVVVEGQATIASVLSFVNGLVFIDSAIGNFSYSAVTGLTASPSVAVAPGSAQSMTVVSDGTDFYVCITGSAINGTTYNPVVKKYKGSDGSLLWSTTLTQTTTQARMVYLSGLGSLQIYGRLLSAAVNPVTGSVAGSGYLPGSVTPPVLCDAGSLTLGAETINTGQATGPLNVLVGVSAGTVKVNYGGSFRSVTGGTSVLSATAPVIRGVFMNGKIIFSDGRSYAVYNPSTNAMETFTATAGSVPFDQAGNSARLMAVQGGCVWYSGFPQDNRNWIKSAKGDPADFDFDPVSPSSSDAIEGNDPLFEGQIGEPMTALIPYTDDVMIFGMTTTIAMLRGNPVDGGRIDLLTNSTGIAFGEAFCMDPYGTIYFFSNQKSVYQLVPGEKPVRISQRIDQAFTNVDLSKVVIRMMWDDVFQGFHVFVTPFASAQAATHFFYELRTGSWFQEEFANYDHSPLAVYVFSGNTASDHAALIGSFDGYVRTFSASASSDDGTPIASRVLIGPLQSKTFDLQDFKEMQGMLGEESGEVSYSILAGDTAEAALNSSDDPFTTGTLVAGLGSTDPIRCSARAIYIDLSATTPWSMERLRLSIGKKGGKVGGRGSRSI